MFKEILKIIPKLDAADLQAMERALQSRFTKIAKGFGKGLTNVFKGAGIAGIALGLVDKLLNPLKEVQEAIDRMLHSSDDIATNAKQFNTTSGKLFKLVQLAKATGLDQDNLNMLLNKYQTAVAEAQADPNKPSAVRNFVGQKDTAEGFFLFIQSLQKMDKNQQLLVQQSVFGEKQILKMADFLQSDFAKLYKDVGLDKITSEKLSGSIEKLAGLNDLQDVLTARRNTGDVVKKSGIINEGMIRSRDAGEQLILQRENERIKGYQNLQNLSQTVDKLMLKIDQMVVIIGKYIPMVSEKVIAIAEYLEGLTKAIMKSPILRRFLPQGKDK